MARKPRGVKMWAVIDSQGGLSRFYKNRAVARLAARSCYGETVQAVLVTPAPKPRRKK